MGTFNMLCEPNRNTKTSDYMKEQTNIYLVMVNADFNEGRGPMLVQHVCTNEQTAIAIAKSLELYPQNYPQFTEVRIMPLITSVERYQIDLNKQIKEKALAKLTQQERAVLGL